jgi:hypothetical protein
MKKDILIPEFLKNYHLALRLNHSDNQEYFYAEHDDSYWIYYNFDIILESFETESEIVVGNLHIRRFLASKASDAVNGQILYVDGGILAYIGRQPK